MANVIPSPNMSLPVPVVGVDPGPDYATNVNDSLTIIDAHDHSPGNGVLITPSGLNINSVLTLNDNSLIDIAALTLFPQSADAISSSIYSKGVDLYFRDGSSNVIRLTQSGSIVGTAGSITGLPSGTASASYSAGTFTFESATSTAANIDGASYVLRNTTPSSHGLTLSPPSSIGADYSITLPNLPGSTSAVNINSSGTMGTITYDGIGQGMTSVGANAVANSRIRTVAGSVSAGGIAVSTSSGLFSTTSPTYVNVLAVNIASTGNPVSILLQGDGSGNTQIGSTGTDNALIQIIRDGTSSLGAVTVLGTYQYPGIINVVDIGAPAGSHSYTLQCLNPDGGVLVYNCILVAYEL